jgi:GTPase
MYPTVVIEFEAESLVLTFRCSGQGYNAQLHCGVVRQTAEIISILVLNKKKGGASGRGRGRGRGRGGTALGQGEGTEQTHNLKKENPEKEEEERNVLRTGGRARVRFRFLRFAEFIVPGSVLLFREGTAKGVGRVSEIFPRDVMKVA